jgi:hypothetical protein
LDPPQVRKVSVREIRQRFNAGDYARRARIGELRQEVEMDLPFPDWKCGQYGLQIGTRSQLVAYYDGPDVVARVHQFLQPDGTLGASQIPDPKELLVDGEIWVV